MTWLEESVERVIIKNRFLITSQIARLKRENKEVAVEILKLGVTLEEVKDYEIIVTPKQFFREILDNWSRVFLFGDLILELPVMDFVRILESVLEESKGPNRKTRRGKKNNPSLESHDRKRGVLLSWKTGESRRKVKS